MIDVPTPIPKYPNTLIPSLQVSQPFYLYTDVTKTDLLYYFLYRAGIWFFCSTGNCNAGILKTKQPSCFNNFALPPYKPGWIIRNRFCFTGKSSCGQFLFYNMQKCLSKNEQQPEGSL